MNSSPSPPERTNGPPPHVFWSPPNLLSLSRVVQAVVLWFTPLTVLWVGGHMAVAALSDMLDGAWARRMRRLHPDPAHATRVEEVGAWLDPVCDKAFVLSLVARLLVAGLLEPVALAVLAAREWILPVLFVLSLVHPASRGVRLPYRALHVGKATTVAQFLAVAAALLKPEWTWTIACVAGALGVLAAGAYVRRAWQTVHSVAAR